MTSSTGRSVSRIHHVPDDVWRTIVTKVADQRAFHAATKVTRGIVLRFLTHLDVSHCTFDELDMGHLRSVSLPSLQQLTWSVDGSPLEALQMVPVEGLLIVRGTVFSTRTVHALCATCKAKRLAVCTERTLVGVRAFCKLMARLEAFELNSHVCKCESLWTALVTQAHNLRQLHLRPRPIHTGTYRRALPRRFWGGLLSSCTSLHELTIDFGNCPCPETQSAGALSMVLRSAHPSVWSGLRRFQVFNSRLVDSADTAALTEVLQKAPLLQRLNLDACTQVNRWIHMGLLESLEWLSKGLPHCRALNTLSLQYNILKSHDLQLLASLVGQGHLPELRHVALTRSQGVNGFAESNPYVGWKCWSLLARLVEALDQAAPDADAISVEARDPTVMDEAGLTELMCTLRTCRSPVSVDVRSSVCSGQLTQGQFSHALMAFVYHPVATHPKAKNQQLHQQQTSTLNTINLFATVQGTHVNGVDTRHMLTSFLGSHAVVCPDVCRLRIYI